MKIKSYDHLLKKFVYPGMPPHTLHAYHKIIPPAKAEAILIGSRYQTPYVLHGNDTYEFTFSSRKVSK